MANFNVRDIEFFNDDVRSWSKDTQQLMIAEMDRLGITHRSYSRSPQPLQRSLRVKNNMRFGIISSISFVFPRHAVFLVKGVSKGHGIYNPRKTTDWFNPPLDDQMINLASIVADHHGNFVVKALKIK